MLTWLDSQKPFSWLWKYLNELAKTNKLYVSVNESRKDYRVWWEMISMRSWLGCGDREYLIEQCSFLSTDFWSVLLSRLRKKYNYFTNKNVGYSNQILSLPMAAIRLLTLSRAALVLCKSLSTSSSAADILNDFLQFARGRKGRFHEFITLLFSTLLTSVESWRLNRRCSNLKIAGPRRLEWKSLKKIVNKNSSKSYFFL